MCIARSWPRFGTSWRLSDKTVLSCSSLTTWDLPPLAWRRNSSSVTSISPPPLTGPSTKFRRTPGFDEAITTLVLGSRRPILFVEGHDENSLDQAIYRCCFPGWTVIPRGSCQEVIHSVVTMRKNEELTRVTCSGIVDADDRQADDITYLDDLGIAVLPVSEIENIILLPPVSRAIAKREGHKDDELEDKLNELKTAVFETLTATEIDAVVMRYCRRRIDRFLKHIDLREASTVPDIKKQYDRQIAKLDIEAIAKQAKTRIEEAVRDKDLPKLLANYDNKGLMALAAKHLRNSKLKYFESWFTRILRNNIEPALVTAINNVLPKLTCRRLAPLCAAEIPVDEAEAVALDRVRPDAPRPS